MVVKFTYLHVNWDVNSFIAAFFHFLQVAEFQEQKREAFRIEQEIAMKILEQESEKMRLQEEKEKQRREKIHAKVRQNVRSFMFFLFSLSLSYRSFL